MRWAAVPRLHRGRTAKRVDRYQHCADIGIYLAARPPLLKVLIDALVADRGQQSHIRDSYLFLLESLFPVGLLEDECIVIRKCRELYLGHLPPSTRFLGRRGDLCPRLL